MSLTLIKVILSIKLVCNFCVNLVRLTHCYYSLGIRVQTHANATPIINERAVTGGKMNVQTLDRVSYLRYARSMYCCNEYEYGSDEYEYEYQVYYISAPFPYTSAPPYARVNFVLIEGGGSWPSSSLPFSPPPLPFPSPLPFAPRLPLETGPLNPVRESEERCKLPSGVWGRVPAEVEFGAF